MVVIKFNMFGRLCTYRTGKKCYLPAMLSAFMRDLPRTDYFIAEYENGKQVGYWEHFRVLKVSK